MVVGRRLSGRFIAFSPTEPIQTLLRGWSPRRRSGAAGTGGATDVSLRLRPSLLLLQMHQRQSFWASPHMRTCAHAHRRGKSTEPTATVNGGHIIPCPAHGSRSEERSSAPSASQGPCAPPRNLHTPFICQAPVTRVAHV